MSTVNVRYALFALLSVSIVASHLSAQVRRRAQEATARRDELARLFDLTRDILLTPDSADAVALIAQYIARRFGLKAVTICVPALSTWEHHHSPGHTLDVERRELDAALAAAKGQLEFDARERTYGGHTSLPMPDGTTVSLVAELEWVQPAEIIEVAIRQVAPVIADHHLDIDAGGEQSLVRLDPRLTSAAYEPKIRLGVGSYTLLFVRRFGPTLHSSYTVSVFSCTAYPGARSCESVSRAGSRGNMSPHQPSLNA
jgi:hypothetical protein